VNVSDCWARVNWFGNGPLGFGTPGAISRGNAAAAGTAATLNAAGTAEWPRVTPGVLNAVRPGRFSNRPRNGVSWK
jgi:hypothetical protein